MHSSAHGKPEVFLTMITNCYSETDVCLIFVSVIDLWSLDTAVKRWTPEVKKYCPKAPIILVSNKQDLQPALYRSVSFEEGRKCMKRIGAVKYMECSARTGEGVEAVFESAIKAALERKFKKTKLFYNICTEQAKR